MSGGILKDGVIASTLDGKPVLKVRCPGHGGWMLIDEDQARGNPSVICGICGFHERVNFLGDLTQCSRCDGQKYDRDNCGLCRNIGWLNADGEPLS